MASLRAFADLVDRLNHRLGTVLRWLAVLMIAIGAYNAVARYLTRSAGVALSSNALNEAQWYLFSLIFLLGAAYGLKVDAHVRVDVLYRRLSGRVQGWIDLLGSLLFLLPFSAVMLWVSFPTVRNSWRIREVSPDPGGLPRYPIKAVILVAFVLLLLQGLAQAVRALDRIRGEGDTSPTDGVPPGGDPGPGEPGAADRGAAL